VLFPTLSSAPPVMSCSANRLMDSSTVGDNCTGRVWRAQRQYWRQATPSEARERGRGGHGWAGENQSGVQLRCRRAPGVVQMALWSSARLPVLATVRYDQAAEMRGEMQGSSPVPVNECLWGELEQVLVTTRWLSTTPQNRTHTNAHLGTEVVLEHQLCFQRTNDGIGTYHVAIRGKSDR